MAQSNHILWMEYDRCVYMYLHMYVYLNAHGTEDHILWMQQTSCAQNGQKRVNNFHFTLLSQKACDCTA